MSFFILWMLYFRVESNPEKFDKGLFTWYYFFKLKINRGVE
jgi:hypothetical protein